MTTLKNLLLITGCGRNSGKTTMVCRIIQQFRNLGIISIKITSHFHLPSDGLILISEHSDSSDYSGYAVYEETNPDMSKDSSQMLHCGAKKVIFAQLKGDDSYNDFLDIIRKLPPNTPVVCESQALRNYIEPGILIIMTSLKEDNQKTTDFMRKFPHLEFSIEDMHEIENLPLDFKNRKWIYLKK